MVSDGFGPPDLISAIKFHFWGQIQDGRRRPYWIAKKTLLIKYSVFFHPKIMSIVDFIT